MSPEDRRTVEEARASHGKGEPRCEYVDRLVAVIDRLQPSTGQCEAGVDLASGGIVRWHQCELRKGHAGMHQCQGRTWARVDTSGTEALEKDIALQREHNREMRLILEAFERRLFKLEDREQRVPTAPPEAAPVRQNAVERIVVSERAELAYWYAACPVPGPVGGTAKETHVREGLRAAFKVMLRDTLYDARTRESALQLGAYRNLYRILTGEEWPG